MRFVNRTQELQEMGQALGEGRPMLYRLYGRRRIGKTALLVHMCKEQGGQYFLAPEGDAATVVASLRAQVASALGDASIPEGWAGFYTALARFEGRPIVIDEFQRVITA